MSYAAIGLVGMKNSLNYGGVLRAAHCLGASMIAFQGPRFKRQASDTTKAYRHIPLIETLDILSVAPFDCQRVAVELVPGARCLTTFVHPKQAIYIFGPEDGSIPTAIVERCQHVVQIPSAYCLNLASTVNVVLYDRIAKAAQRKAIAA